MGRPRHRRLGEPKRMSEHRDLKEELVAEDRAEYGLVLLADGELPSPALSAVMRGIAEDEGGRPYTHSADDEDDAGSFVFVVPWYSHRDRRPAAGGRPAASALT